MKEVLHELIEHRSLDKQAARNVLVDLATAKFNPAQMAAFMTVYMMRNITVPELEGFRDAMLELCVRVEFDRPVIDVCGTGGDGKNTFNISTLSAFVVAAAGQAVAKHGNYGVSSACGSSNLLEYFGYRFSNDIDWLRSDLDRANICFMHAPLFHPAMKNVAPIRKELGVKTFFNMLGPMVNPAFPKYQMIGVFSLELARQYGYLYQQTDKRYMVLHTLEGYDEISLTAPVKYYSDQGEYLITPRELGFDTLTQESIDGGDTVEAAANIFLSVLEGRGTVAQNSVVIANAAMALHCAQPQHSISTCIERANDVLISGKAYDCFKRLMTR